MQVCTLEHRGHDIYDIRIVEVSSGDLVAVDDGKSYQIRDGVTPAKIIVVQRSIRGIKNATVRADRLTENYGAVPLSDGESVKSAIQDEAMAAKRTKKVQVPPPEVVADIDEEDLDVEIMALGFKARDVKGLSLASKQRIAREGLAPVAIKILTGGAIEVLGAPSEEEEGEEEEGEEEEADAPLPKPRAAPVTTAPPRGFRLHIFRAAWEDGRTYDAGQTSDREEVDRVAAAWGAAGFKTRIEALPQHHRATAQRHTLCSEPVEPILCAVPGCQWVGDHLGPHLSAHGMELEGYRTVYGYKGPGMVGKAAQALSRAHESVRRSHDIRSGMFLAEIRGDQDVDLWRLDAIEDDRRIFVLSWVTGPKSKPGERVTGPEILRRMLPVTYWARRVKQEMGGDGS